VGYGTMSETETSRQHRHEAEKERRSDRLEKQREAKIQSEIRNKGYCGLAEQIFKEMRNKGWDQKHDLFYKAADKWLPKIKAEKAPHIKAQCVAILTEILESFYKGIMQNPLKTKGKRNKPYYKPIPIQIAMKLRSIKTELDD
jgi:hypothetical protein